MSSLLVTAIILGIFYGYRYYKESQEEKEMEESRFYEELTSNKENENSMTEGTKVKQLGTRDLVLETLPKIGCQYTIDEDNNNRIGFTFQGEHFVIDASNDYLMIDIWDLWWAEQELYDIDGLSRLKRAINEANINTSITTVYSINEAGSNVGVHSHKNLLFIPQIPNIENYLQAMLADFFRVHRYIATELDKLKVDEDNRNVGRR